MTVTFCGHAELTADDCEYLKERVTHEIEDLIKKGAKKFLLGGYGEFDSLCAVCVKKLKSIYPDIESILVIPYLDRKYDMHLYDSSIYPPIESVPKRFAISKRNEYMIESADVVVSFIKHTWGGAYKTTCFAKRKKKQIITI